MKNTVTILLLLVTALFIGCQTENRPAPEQNTSWTSQIIGTDSITTGNFLGININEEAAPAYKVIQGLQQTKGVSYLNIVGNISSDLEQLHHRIPLYVYILLDGNQGTDSGVQITLESGQVKSIYLNSGTKLKQWPGNAKAESSIRIGDHSEDLYAKFVRIKDQSSYSSKFERIMLLTKDVSASYDPVMAQSPQWYFVNRTGNLWDQVQIHLKDGKVSYIKVIHYKD